MSTRAVCVRCGGLRSSFEAICPSCGHRPDGEGLLIAWLLSEHNLDETGIERVQLRIRDGEAIRPSARMLDKARRALGTHFSTDAGLSGVEHAGLLAVNLLLTPLVGWVLFAWWRTARPRAALQALRLTLPVTVLFTVLVLYLMSPR
ncbi:MAG TPA: hypothetical protein ENK18_05975 [Deltaproteobacteria bacterium]|nr:hypothetical protein [Deltaproteobacteria bacterium]